ncbi:DNA-directed RNA polymerase subunit beta' [Tengunoibacter tsumagoiensis]|uniref:DNA-directed RNA polymerase subunit beta' n=1 Tax=Tengunoibacter tsumagoiensis TaxID=2014871 RepID=A0A402A7E9_9CHLR|nr:DNA-directed RNA polymerase subunit beta' [Tengunoibacter tsumagoiensis]GCE15048.1 DNA-directed RNA polymerase subunit beta' [Tengunoibacter tsumagoiensis]
MRDFDTIAALRIGLARAEDIHHWSHGEVTKAETIHFRTQKPVKDGLFCEVIFGPIRDWSCTCGKYHYKRQPGIICEKCGVELAPAAVRRERMGHIDLATPVAHPWHLRTIGLLLDLSPWQVASLLTYQRYLILQIDEEQRRNTHDQFYDTGDQHEKEAYQRLLKLTVGDLLETGHYQTVSRLFPGIFIARTGGDAVHHLLATLDLNQLATTLQQEIAVQGANAKKAIRRLHVINAFRTSGQHPDWMILSTIPVLPPELRPLLVLDGGRIASSDLNELYSHILHRNNRLKRFLEQNAPEIILNNERRLLQEACHALFDNAHKKKKTTDSRRRPMKSLTDVLQGKQGRFRRNLLGKRVDYSGRSVIVAGPNLKLHECGLPKEMAYELFKPFVIGKLLDHQYARSPKEAKRMVEQRDGLIWDVLDEVLFERVVLLNRAPTLHRLSIQAFHPRLIEGKAIQLHPLVCSAFNADFDGDQMAVHLPLSQRAQEEAHRLLLSTRNVRHPASGEPSISPSQEIVLGCFYLTEDRPDSKKGRHVYTDRNEARLAYTAGHIDLHTQIQVRIGDMFVYTAPPPAEPTHPAHGRVETTIGRVLFNDILPAQLGYRNYPMTKDTLKALLAECISTGKDEDTIHLLDEIKRIGYHYATKSGISFAISDIKIPPERETLIAKGRKQVSEGDLLYKTGEMTYDEWYRQTIEIWTQITEEISGKLKDVLDPFGTIMTIVKSGATKAKFQQIRQLSGIRGLMASPSGKILPIPVLSNYRLGLLVWEIFIAASGARKGFMDRSLNTAMSGYLTRRLVEAGMEVIVTQRDCQTREGLLITHEESHRMGLPTMRSRMIGRVLAEHTGNVAAGTLLDEHLVDTLLQSGIEHIRVRSPFYCQAPYGICQTCYGTDLATGKLIRLGVAVGVLAGQAIGEPGTQLTMRTFHSGGIANNASDITLGLPRVNDLFEVHPPTQAAPMAERSGIVKQIETEPQTGGYHIHFTSTNSQEPAEWITTIPFRRKIVVQEGQSIERGTPLVEGPLNPHDILQLLGQDMTQRYLIQEIQKVYRGTGAVIHDKHIEVIVRQMLRHVLVCDAGDTDLLPGSIIDRFTFLQCVASVLAQGGQPPVAQPHLLGLTNTVLHTASWIAAASFQDMSRVLSRAAIWHQQDNLVGLKERLIVGKILLTQDDKGKSHL